MVNILADAQAENCHQGDDGGERGGGGGGVAVVKHLVRLCPTKRSGTTYISFWNGGAIRAPVRTTPVKWYVGGTTYTHMNGGPFFCIYISLFSSI